METNLPSYKYGIKYALPKSTSSIDNIEQYNNIYLCVYYVNEESKFPFLQYLLFDPGYTILSFPKLEKHSFLNNENVVDYSKLYLLSILQIEKLHLDNPDMEFDGFYEYNENLYLFIDITICKKYIDRIDYLDYIQFALIDEIVNHKKVCNKQINEQVTNFIIDNDSTWYLYNKDNKPYELPIIGYVGKSSESKLLFTYTFGVCAKDKKAILGPYFYFTNYENSLNQAKNVAIINEKKGVIRFALFIGEQKYIENSPNDAIDNSVIKDERLKDTTLDKKIEALTLRISDHDGIWAKTFDSVLLNKLELDDGTILSDTPMIVLKQYNQQTPLSYHYI